MSKNRPLAISALLASAVAGGAVAAGPAMAADTNSSTSTKTANTATTNAATPGAATTNAVAQTGRIGGADRYGTAIAASKADFPVAGSAAGVVIARGDEYVDALAGTPLAAGKHAALLLTDSKTLSPGVADEIKRVLGAADAAKTKKITILGGDVAVTPAVEKQLKALGYSVERIGGVDRYATALDIATTTGAKNAIVATGMNFADALAAGPLAAASDGSAIVLSNGQTVTDAATAAFIKGAGTVTSVGQPAVNAVGKLGVKDTELAGPTRYETAAAVAGSEALKGSKSAVVANGLVFTDPLVGGVYAAYNHGALLLTDPHALPASTAAALVGFTTPLEQVTIFGGENAVSAGVATQIQSVLAGGYGVYIQQLKDAVAAAQKAYDAAAAVPGLAEVVFDKAAQTSTTDTKVKDAENALFDAAKVSSDTNLVTAYTAYTKALDAVQGAGSTPSKALVDALSTARYNLQAALAASTDKAVATGVTNLWNAVKATTDKGIADAAAAAIKAENDNAATIKAAGDKLAAAEKALADAQK